MMKGVKKGYKHKKITKRNRTEDVLELVETDWKSTNFLVKKSTEAGIYSTGHSVKKHLEILVEEDKVEMEIREDMGKNMFWRLKNK